MDIEHSRSIRDGIKYAERKKESERVRRGIITSPHNFVIFDTNTDDDGQIL